MRPGRGRRSGAAVVAVRGGCVRGKAQGRLSLGAGIGGARGREGSVGGSEGIGIVMVVVEWGCGWYGGSGQSPERGSRERKRGDGGGDAW